MSGNLGNIDVDYEAADRWADEVDTLNDETDKLLIEVFKLIKEFTDAAEGSYIDDINKGLDDLYNFGKYLHQQLSHMSQGFHDHAKASRDAAERMVEVAKKLGGNV